MGAIEPVAVDVDATTPRRASRLRRVVVATARAARVAPVLLRAAVTPRRAVARGNRVLMLTISDVDHDPRVLKVARSLAEGGYDVDVLAPTTGEARTDDVLPGVRYSRITREWLWRYFVVYQEEFRQAGLARAFDFVHANDLTTLTVGWVLARARGVPLIYDAHELWTENMSPTADGWKPMSGPMRALAIAWERYLLRSADQVTTVSPSIVTEYGRRNPNRPQPALLPNYPSTKLLEAPPRVPSLRDECGVAESDFLTLYLGGVNPLRNIENVIRAHRHLPDNFVFAVRGPGIDAYARDYRKLARAEGVADRVVLLPSVPMNDVVAAAQGADCGIVMLRNLCKNFYYFFPNKLFEYALAGIPVAASDFPDIRTFVLAERCGVTFDPDSPTSIAAGLQWLGEDPIRAREMGERGRRSVLERRNWESAVGVLLGAYDRMPRTSD
jgi:glycosyltransferase involved in cell wall biosynthesis